MAKGGKTPRKKSGSSPNDLSGNYVMPQADKQGASLNPNVPNAPKVGDTVGAGEPLPGALGSGRQVQRPNQLPPLPSNVRQSEPQPTAPVTDDQGRTIEFGIRKVGERKVKKQVPVQEPGKSYIIYEPYPGGVLSPSTQQDRLRLNAELERNAYRLPPGSTRLLPGQKAFDALPPADRATVDRVRDSSGGRSDYYKLRDGTIVLYTEPALPGTGVYDTQKQAALANNPGGQIVNERAGAFDLVFPDGRRATVELKPQLIPLLIPRVVNVPPTTKLVETEETEDVFAPYESDSGTSTRTEKGKDTQGVFYFTKGRLFQRGK